MQMTSIKPYLIRSIYEWILDNQLTPHLLIDAENTSSVSVLPQDFIEGGKIVFNIKPEAIQELQLGNDEIQFDASFSGKSIHVITPTTSVLAIYAQENGKGMVFDPEEDSSPPPVKQKHKKPQLRIIK